MPFPPRPLPAQRRPGQSVPHKPKSTLSPTSANTLDWRTEVAFLDSYAHSRKARSVPSAGVAIMDAATRARASAKAAEGAAVASSASVGAREVGLEELIHDGKTKREKRATTAASLGFDFIHTPAVMVLPDSPSAKASAVTRTPTKPHHTLCPSPLATTPQTPGLISSSALPIPSSSTAQPRASSSDAEADDESDLDEWEHVDVNGEEDDLVLGELELEDRDELGPVDLVDRKEAVGMRRVDGVSYAAALGR